MFTVTERDLQCVSGSGCAIGCGIVTIVSEPCKVDIIMLGLVHKRYYLAISNAMQAAVGSARRWNQMELAVQNKTHSISKGIHSNFASCEYIWWWWF